MQRIDVTTSLRVSSLALLVAVCIRKRSMSLPTSSRARISGQSGKIFHHCASAAAGQRPLTTLPPTTVVSTVGAGDSSLFGYLFGDVTRRDPGQRLALAVAYGSAAAGLPGTTIPHPRQVQTDLVHVTRLDLPSGD